MRNISVLNLSLLIVSILAIPMLNAQTLMSDSVFLKNGNLIIGKINKYVPNEYLKINTKNGMFFFLTNDISKLAIHTNNLNDLILTTNLPNKNNGSTSKNTTDDVYNKIQYPDTVKFIPVGRSKFNDYIPVNLFFVQTSFEIGTIYTPFDVDWQTKFQAIYSRRFIPDYAFGLGACFRFFDFYSIAKVLFIDIRTVRPKGNSFTSVSLDPGIVFYDGSAGLNLNIAFNYGKRIQKNLFFTLGFDLNYQSNTYGNYYSGNSGSVNPGVSIGLMF